MKTATTILLLGATLILLGPPTAQGSYRQGSYYQQELQAAKKKCPSKSGKAKRKCQRRAKQQAARKTRRQISSPSRLYGFSLPAKRIPATSGKLIWSKQLRRSAGAGRTDFILYSSRAYPGGQKIAVSGTVSTPPGRGPWPVISWAHGTTGLADQCAPSRGGDQGSYGGAEPLISEFLRAGYAVVATDYQGLGTPGPHPYLVGESQGRGVVDIVPAARQFRPLTRKTFIAGHSQGGHAALFAARGNRKMPFAHRGTISYAPPAFLDVQAQSIATQPEDAYGLAALGTSILRGMTIANPEIKPQELLTDQALALYPQSATLCLDQLSTAFGRAGVGPQALLRPDWLSSPSGQPFLQALQQAQPALAVNKPLLIVQGFDDTTVLQFFTRALYFDLRALSPGLVDYITYDDWLESPTSSYQTAGPSTHSSILGDSLNEVKTFLAAQG